MVYEKDAFATMHEYYSIGKTRQLSYSDEFKDLQEKARRFWIQKDQALLQTIENTPN